MRVGIVGQIEGYNEGTTSYGQGLPEDAAQISREHPDSTIRYEGQDGTVRWYEAGVEVPMPEWAGEQSE